MSRDASELTLENFLKVSSQFQLGRLPTEQSHPLTHNLSLLAKQDLPAAIETLREVELQAFAKIQPQLPKVTGLARDVAGTLRAGGRVFLCGCGATGRLAVQVETLWRENPNVIANGWQDRVISFIAGGDFALVRSIENFEDHPEFGARQLQELGYLSGDLLISCTEGGETPFVIGATWEAVAQNNRDQSMPERNRSTTSAPAPTRAPYFLYCNPDSILCDVAERSRSVITSPDINTICLDTGPMAVCGSTRLQASSVLLFAVGAAVLQAAGETDIHTLFRVWLETLKSLPLLDLAQFIEREANIYEQGDYLLHATNNFGLCVLTDTTERSPTFSLLPFENQKVLKWRKPISWTYLWMPASQNSDQAWDIILHRQPRALDWPELGGKYNALVTNGFDFSYPFAPRSRHVTDAHHHVFKILEHLSPNRDPNRSSNQTPLSLELDELHAQFSLPESRLLANLQVKIMLNISSNLVMGRLGRFDGNAMTWVRASNLKLVDRAIRFTQIWLEQNQARHFDYATIAAALFQIKPRISPDQSIVLETAKFLANSQASSAV